MGGITDDDLLETDLYGMLDISSTSSDDQIRAAYKKKARLLHPGMALHAEFKLHII